MDMRRLFLRNISISFYILLASCYSLAFSACGPNQALISTATTTLLSLTEEQPTSVPTITMLQPQPTPSIACKDNLLFINDVTIPDNTVVAPGIVLDKQWLVQNNGNCNWDTRYRLRLVSGAALGASPEQALYPARAGTQVNLRILFTAPQETGDYVSEWQAFDANGIPFGDSFFMKIIVQ